MQNREGQQLGNYRLKRRLDGGGYADVYQAEHIYLEMKVAVKVLKSSTLTPVDRQKFLDEAKIVAMLDHPHIVKILEFGIETSQQDANSIPYLVMEYAQEGTLRKLHPRGTRVPLEKIALYVKQIADALDYAHNPPHEIVHRDVKPENMLIKRTDHILLSDFGIAVAGFNTGNLPEQLARYAGNKGTVMIPGTPTYIAPERLSEQPRIQRSSDQYSLAIVVYEWLTGTPPFTGSETDICRKHLTAAPPSLSKAPHNIAPEIEDVVMKALAKKPDFRHQTIKGFATALEAAIQTARARQSPPVAPYRPSQPNQPPAQPQPQWVPQQPPAQPQQQWVPQQPLPQPQQQWVPQQPPLQPQPVQAAAAPIIAPAQPPWLAGPTPPHQLSQEQTQIPARQPQGAGQQPPPATPQPPPATPQPWTQPAQMPGPAMPPHINGSQPTGAQAALFQQAPGAGMLGPTALPPPGQNVQGMPPQALPAMPSPAPNMQGPPPGIPPANNTWAISNTPWHQGGYIPLNTSGGTTNSNMTSRGVAPPGQPVNAYTTNDIAATAREFGDGLSKFRRRLQSTFELDLEFFRLHRFRLFRLIGFVTNVLSVTLVSLFILHDWWVWFFGIILSLSGLFLCIAAVKKPLAITGGLLVALWWTYVGYGIDLIWPVAWMRPPTIIPQVIFFAVSAIIHTWYAIQKSD